MQTQRTCLPLQYTPLDSVHTPTGVYSLCLQHTRKLTTLYSLQFLTPMPTWERWGDLEWNVQNNGKANARSVSLRVDTWQCKIEPNHHYKVSDIITHTYKCKFICIHGSHKQLSPILCVCICMCKPHTDIVAATETGMSLHTQYCYCWRHHSKGYNVHTYCMYEMGRFNPKPEAPS